MLCRSPPIEELFDAIYKWLGAVKGGLASATVLACTALAALVGVVGTTEVTMGMIALPAMLKRGYDQKLAIPGLVRAVNRIEAANRAHAPPEIFHRALALGAPTALACAPGMVCNQRSCPVSGDADIQPG
jgi:tripartite ATP-independent transporter DctM subunit